MRGFTLLEVVAVLILVGLLTYAAVPKMNYDNQNLYRAVTILRNHLQYAQMRSLSYGEQYGVRSVSGNSYVLFRNSTSTTMPFPGGGKPYTLDSNVSISSFNVSFDSWGTPYNGTNKNSPLESPMVITITGSGESKTVKINAATGFVE